MTTGGEAASAPLRRANRLPMASTRSSRAASRHQRAKSSRPSRSAAVSVTRRTPPLAVAPMRASSMSEDHRRSPLIIGIVGVFMQPKGYPLTIAGMKSIEIDRSKRLRDEPHTGHNRWHPDIPPALEVEPGEDVALETRDANDLQINPRTTVKDLEKLERTVAHPLTGPVCVKGAKPGDLLEIEY